VLDHLSEHVEPETVVPRFAGMIQERQGRELVHELRAAHRGARSRAAAWIELVHGRISACAIDQAGGVHHQVAQRDRLPRGHLAGDRLALLVELGDLHVGELREVLRQRVVDQQLAALMQLQRRERDHRLGHRRDVEDRVLGHRDARRLVAETERLVVGELALAGDRDHAAGNASGLDVGIEALADLAEPLGGEPDFLGLGARQRIAVERDGSGRFRHRVHRVRHGLGMERRAGDCRSGRRGQYPDGRRRLPGAFWCRASRDEATLLQGGVSAMGTVGRRTTGPRGRHGATSTCLQAAGRSAIVSGGRGFGGSFGGLSTPGLNQ
jgi:hypothetical protein